MNTRPNARAEDLRIGAVVVAAGESRRMGGIDKIFYELKGLPLVWHSIAALLAHQGVSEVVLVTSRANLSHAKSLIESQDTGSVSVCEGGDRRQDSVRLGLERLAECDFVTVHDGARPFIDRQLVKRGITAAQANGAAVAAVPVKDTVKLSDDGEIVSETLPRERLWSVQTPQIFSTSLLQEAHQRVTEMVTDDASMVEAIGHPVRLFFGSYYNIKVTTPEDLVLARAIAEHIHTSNHGYNE